MRASTPLSRWPAAGFIVAATLAGCIASPPPIPASLSDGGATDAHHADARVACGAACAPKCGAAESVCASDGGPYCASLTSDSRNCGACGKACGAAGVCVGGSCVTACPTGQALCSSGDAGSYCATPETDNANCGGCGLTCAGGLACVGGHCAVSCAVADVNCGGVCIDPMTDPQHCGASGGCGDGGAGTACGALETCENGACVVTGNCAVGQSYCPADGGKVCVDEQTDTANCGACGNVCVHSPCVSGMCTPTFTFGVSGAAVTWTAPVTGWYRIEAWGASGGNGFSGSGLTESAGGRGADIRGDFQLSLGQTLTILVGGRGSSPGNTGAGQPGGGGGASFVGKGATTSAAAAAPLVVAGGGGGGSESSANTPGTAASTATSGVTPPGGGLAGGTNGGGGGSGTTLGGPGGGGGGLTGSATAPCGGTSLENGGAPASAGICATGAFGGAGAATYVGGGGGGGGYSGGGGGAVGGGGGGGGSFVAATASNPLLGQSSVPSGSGLVVITVLP